MSDDLHTTVWASGEPPAPAPPAPKVVTNILFGPFLLLHQLRDNQHTAEVWEAEDSRDGGRRVVLKRLHPNQRDKPTAHAAFRRETQLTMRLEHPGIVPVYSQGEEQGWPYYVMRKLPGGTLRAHIAAVWEAAQGELSPQALRGLLQILLRVCEAMALAHDTGMLHRDLNPTQVLLGNYGEAVVLDWGLVGMVGEACVGWTVAGMSPEQARGEPLDARADVYALGMILLEILEGRVPWSAERESWLDHIRSGRVPEPQRGPEPLQALCRACLAPEPAARPPDARALARRLSDYLEDALREEDARAQLQHALALEPEIAAIQAHITELWQRTAAERSRLLPWSSEQEHARLWALEDQIRAARLRRTEQRLAQEELLQIGRERSPGLPELLDQLAILYRERFEDAEKALDEEGVLRAQRRLVGVDRQGLHRAWLARPCELHISTDPPALMEIFRYEERGRRLVPCLVTGASSPWTGSLKPGSYLIKIQVPSGCVQLPLLLERGQDPRFVHLPLPPLGPEDCLVAAGPYAEGDEQAPEGLPERIRTLPTFVVRKFPMRVREYFDFLNGLIAEGRMEEAELHAPFSEFAGFGSPGGPCWQWEGGRMVPGKDERGLLLPEQPIMQIRWDDAVAATAWFAKQSGLPWRLPYEREWEKAARGVDGRRWPWGNYFLPVWAAVADFSSETPSRQVVDSFPVDESPYGMRGAAGNIREWCLDQYHRQEDADGKPVNLYPDLRMVRGGGYYNTAEYARVGARRADAPGHHRDSIGFRMFRPLADPG